MRRTAKRLFFLYAYIGFGIIICSGSLKAQFQKNEMTQNKWSVGAEGGWMKNFQTGSFQLVCKCPVQEGKGNSGFGALFIEFRRNAYLSFGMKLGVDHKSTSTLTDVNDTAVITYSQHDSIVSGAYVITRAVDVSATYFFFAPYFKISPFSEGIYIQIAPEFGILTSSHLTHTRKVPNTIILDNGQIITNLRFQNGTQEETLQDGGITNVKSLRIALFFGIGYDIPIFGNFSLLPQASYNFALTTMSTNPNESNWKISSLALTLGLKYGL